MCFYSLDVQSSLGLTVKINLFSLVKLALTEQNCFTLLRGLFLMDKHGSSLSLTHLQIHHLLNRPSFKKSVSYNKN